jgi:hypothetical protein
MPFLRADERATLRAVVDRLVPAVDTHPGAMALGAVDYIDGLLNAFAFDPPRIWAGGPYSDRAGSPVNNFLDFLELGPLEELAWRTRIEGSLGLPEREFNGPVIGWQTHYRVGLAALGTDFADVDDDGQRARLNADREFRDLVYQQTVQGCYSAPEYGGNRDTAGWRAILFPGDVQPRGFTDAEVAEL